MTGVDLFIYVVAFGLAYLAGMAIANWFFDRKDKK